MKQAACNTLHGACRRMEGIIIIAFNRRSSKLFDSWLHSLQAVVHPLRHSVTAVTHKYWVQHAELLLVPISGALGTS
jgi:long-subunit acyl-CoA synthetase (AMP-forming)